MEVETGSQQVDQTVSPRQWVRLLVVYLLIPLILFVCAGDLAWFQAWIYTSLILLSGIGGRIWAEQRHPGLTAARQNKATFRKAKPWDKVLAPLMAVSIVFPMVIVAGLDHRFSLSPEFPLWVNTLGLAFIAFGYIFAAWAMMENRFFFSVVCIQENLGHKVCDTGPYRFLRHPGYAGNILPLFGISLALNSLWSLIPATVAIIIIVIRTSLEDQTLKEELSGYKDYTHSVRSKLIPWVY